MPPVLPPMPCVLPLCITSGLLLSQTTPQSTHNHWAFLLHGLAPMPSTNPWENPEVYTYAL